MICTCKRLIHHPPTVQMVGPHPACQIPVENREIQEGVAQGSIQALITEGVMDDG